MRSVPGGSDTIKSGSIHLKPLNHVTSTSKTATTKETRVRRINTMNRRGEDDESGILEERGESTCSSKNPKQGGVFSSDCGDGTSSMYPRLKDVPETRNSCAVIETLGSNNGRLEGTEELKMPPVSTAIASKRARKLSTNESLTGNMKLK